jgi:hypothetical protein
MGNGNVVPDREAASVEEITEAVKLSAKEVKYFQDYDKRVEKARKDFGEWDAVDPVVLAILKLVEIQNQIAYATGEWLDSEEDSHKLIEEKRREREQAALDLQKALFKMRYRDIDRQQSLL